MKEGRVSSDRCRREIHALQRERVIEGKVEIERKAFSTKGEVDKKTKIED